MVARGAPSAEGVPTIARKLALALLVLCSLAGNAEAKTRYLSPVGSDSSNGQTSLTPWRTFAHALDYNVFHDDTLICGPSAGVIASGAYADGMVPVASINLNGLVVIGDSVRPNTTVIPEINVNSGNDNKHYENIKIVGFRVNGDFSAKWSNIANTGTDGLVLRHCIIRNNTNIDDVDINCFATRFGIAPDTGSSWFRSAVHYKPMNMVLRGCNIDAGPSNNSYTGFAVMTWTDFTLEDPNVFTWDSVKVRVYAHKNWASDKPYGFRGWRDSRITDCRFELVDSTETSGNLSQGILFRDNLEGNIFLRDTLISRAVGSGSGGGCIRFASVGSNEFSYNVGERNVYRYCWFQAKGTTIMSSNGRIGYDWQIQPSDSFYHNVVAVSSTADAAGFVVNNVIGQGYIGYNTFFCDYTGGAVQFNSSTVSNCPYWNGQVVFKNNIVYVPRTGTGATDFAMYARVPGVRMADHLDSDYNFYTHYGSATGGRSIYAALCGNTQALYSPTTAFTEFGIDKHSLYGSPQFTDSSYATFNPTLTSASPCRCAGENGTTIGAMDFDCYRPYQVTDIRVSGMGPTSAQLVWSAVGDDSLTGTATSYDVRYSTSLISEANWSSATTVTGEPTPSVSGTIESMTITGLTASTTYFFAIKVTDEGGNQSALSNVVARTTPALGPDFAEP